MAQPINTALLTLNIQETPSFGEFINQMIFEQPALASIHKIMQGVTMEQQMVIAGRMSKMGISDTACTRPNSGATIALKPKNTKPQPVGDTLEICQKDLNFMTLPDQMKKPLFLPWCLMHFQNQCHATHGLVTVPLLLPMSTVLEQLQ
jgi:hypothetical protein